MTLAAIIVFTLAGLYALSDLVQRYRLDGWDGLRALLAGGVSQGERRRIEEMIIASKDENPSAR